MSFFEGIVPTLNQFSEDEVLEFQSEVLRVLTEIKRRRTSSQAAMPQNCPPAFRHRARASSAPMMSGEYENSHPEVASVYYYDNPNNSSSVSFPYQDHPRPASSDSAHYSGHASSSQSVSSPAVRSPDEDVKVENEYYIEY